VTGGKEAEGGVMKPPGEAIRRFRNLCSGLTLLAAELADKLDRGEVTAEYLHGLHELLTTLAKSAEEGADALAQATIGEKWRQQGHEEG
jgi:hypothetical protein